MFRILYARVQYCIFTSVQKGMKRMEFTYFTPAKVIFGKDGGHGMLFRKLDGSLAFALHQPNAVRRERPKFFPVEDDGETLRIVPE